MPKNYPAKLLHIMNVFMDELLNSNSQVMYVSICALVQLMWFHECCIWANIHVWKHLEEQLTTQKELLDQNTTRKSAKSHLAASPSKPFRNKMELDLV